MFGKWPVALATLRVGLVALITYLILDTQSSRFNSDSWKNVVAGLTVGLVSLFTGWLGLSSPCPRRP